MMGPFVVFFLWKAETYCWEEKWSKNPKLVSKSRRN